MRRSRLPFTRATAAAVACLGVSLGLAGCGFDVQSLQPDLSGQGVNVNAGQVRIRDLVVVETGAQTGRLAGTLTSPTEDQMVSVAGFVHNLDGRQGAPLTTTGQAVTVPAGGVVILTDGPGVMVASPDLKAGLTVDLTLRFRSGAQTTVKTVIVDKSNPVYRSVTPAPSVSTSRT